MPYGVRRAVPCTASLRLVGWIVPVGVAHVHSHGYLGSDPHTYLDRSTAAVGSMARWVWGATAREEVTRGKLDLLDPWHGGALAAKEEVAGGRLDQPGGETKKEERRETEREDIVRAMR